MLNESVDSVGIVPGEVALVREDNGGRLEAQIQRVLESIRVGVHVDNAVLDALGIHPAQYGSALDATILSKDSDHG